MMLPEPSTIAEMKARRRAAEERIAAAVEAHRRAQEQRPTPEPQVDLLADLLARHQHGERWLLSELLTVVCIVFRVTPEAIKGPDRYARIVHVRQVFMWLARRFSTFATGAPASFTEIGRMAGRDHTTACHAYHKIAALVAGSAPPEENTPVAWAQKLRAETLPLTITRIFRIHELAAAQMTRREIAAELQCSRTLVNKALAA